MFSDIRTRYFVAGLILSIVCLALPSVAVTGEVADPGTSALLSYDFTADLDDQVLVDRRGASGQSDALIGVKALGATSRHPKDEIILGRKLLAGDNWWTVCSTMMLITEYLSDSGTVPVSGVDLFPELAGADAYTAFTGLIPTHRMIKYGPAINLATNRFYQTFSDPQWHAGGIYVELLESRGSGEFEHDGHVLGFVQPGDTTLPDRAIYYKVFSGAEGEVLFEDYLTFDFN